MPDFSQLLKGSSLASAKRPPSLPDGLYRGLIQKYELTEAKSENKTPIVRYHVGLTEWPQAIEEDDRKGIELSKKKLSKDYFYTTDAMWRLAKLLKTCGVIAEGKSDEEMIAAAVGEEVIVKISEIPTKGNPEETYNQIDSLEGLNG